MEERANSEPMSKMTIDERIQKLLGERALFERRLEEAHVHLLQIKSSWSSKIESLETQVGRLCRQASEESSEKRRAEKERDDLMLKINRLESDYESVKSDCESTRDKLKILKIEKDALEDEMKILKIKKEDDVENYESKIVSER
mgnify:FL=1